MIIPLQLGCQPSLAKGLLRLGGVAHTLFSSMQSRCQTPSPGSLMVRQMMRVDRLEGRRMHWPTGTLSSLVVSWPVASCMLMFLKSGCWMGREVKACRPSGAGE